MNLIASKWEEFNRAILIPAGASSLQTEEMRKAFYVGAQSLLSALLGNFSNAEEPTPDDLQIMDEVARELRLFFSNMQPVKAGQA